MKQLLLDTSAYSNYSLGVESVHDVVSEAKAVYLSPIVIGELEAGFRGGSRTADNQRLLSRFLDKPEVGVCAVTRTTAECYAAILDHFKRVGRPIPSNDIWIAASAMEHGLVVVTFDAHFRDIPQVRSDVHVRG